MNCSHDKFEVDIFDDEQDIFNEFCNPVTIQQLFPMRTVYPITDENGYFVGQQGEVLNLRYETRAKLGQGSFGSVFEVYDRRKSELAVVKFCCIGDRSAAKNELSILKKLAEKDPDDKYHCVRLKSQFEHRDHFCLVLCKMEMNLRKHLRTQKARFGIGGLDYHEVAHIGKQIFVALRFLKHCGIVHTDLKPDNILISRGFVRICDFGCAMNISACRQSTSDIGTLWYKAPEVVLGAGFDSTCDVWSTGAVLWELATGKPMYKARSSNDLLRFHLEYHGAIPKKMLKKGKHTSAHFRSNGIYMQTVTSSKGSGHMVYQRMREDLILPQRQMKNELRRRLKKRQRKGLDKVESADYASETLANLLRGCFMLDPKKRWNAKKCYAHKFFADGP
mmetsp:Transcript_30104/g.73280  ORF Transcript_30104/g.73280 Transcript_30104/m.73280 type:complete len:391 (-) Transcript_30104:186-1358(-)